MTETHPDNSGKHDAALQKIELLQLDEQGHEEYMLRNRNEVLSILRAMLKDNSRMTVHFNEGQDYLMSTLLEVSADGNSMVLDVGNDATMNRSALASHKLICIANLDKVKIQFVLDGVRETKSGGQPAFLADVPKELLRLQRREYYRLTVPVVTPLRCQIPCLKPDGSTVRLEANILDISGGGVGIIAQMPGVELQAGMEFQNCRIDLPGVGIINVTLHISSVFDVTLRNGIHSRRSGCQFTNLSPQMENQIQRYIIKAERDRKARSAGLD